MTSEKPQPSARVLVVDDDPMVASSLSNILLRAGYDVTTCSGPADAMARMEAAPLDVLVSDISMPQMTGLEMLSALRSRGRTLPVVFLTGAPKVEDTMRAMELGAFRYLAKPVEKAALIEVVGAEDVIGSWSVGAT